MGTYARYTCLEAQGAKRLNSLLISQITANSRQTVRWYTCCTYGLGYSVGDMFRDVVPRAYFPAFCPEAMASIVVISSKISDSSFHCQRRNDVIHRPR